MSDDTLRAHLIANFVGQPYGYDGDRAEADADDIIEVLRANREAVLQALCGVRLREENLARPGSDVPVIEAEVWAFAPFGGAEQ